MRLTQRTGLFAGFAALALMLTAAVAPAQTWNVSKTYPIGGEGAWDYLTVDAASHRLFVPRTTHTQIIDEDSGKVLGDVPGQKGAHGVAVVPSSTAASSPTAEAPARSSSSTSRPTQPSAVSRPCRTPTASFTTPARTSSSPSPATATRS